MTLDEDRKLTKYGLKRETHKHMTDNTCVRSESLGVASVAALARGCLAGAETYIMLWKCNSKCTETDNEVKQLLAMAVFYKMKESDGMLEFQ